MISARVFISCLLWGSSWSLHSLRCLRWYPEGEREPAAYRWMAWKFRLPRGLAPCLPLAGPGVEAYLLPALCSSLTPLRSGDRKAGRLPVGSDKQPDCPIGCFWCQHNIDVEAISLLRWGRKFTLLSPHWREAALLMRSSANHLTSSLQRRNWSRLSAGHQAGEREAISC